MTAPAASGSLARGRALEWVTLGWNVVAVGVLGVLAAAASSVALVGFGLDSLIEIGASTVVLWELSGTGETRQRRALRLIGIAFVVLAVYLVAQSTLSLIVHHHPSGSPLGIVWTALTVVLMFALAFGKTRVGRSLGNRVLIAEGRVTFIDGVLAVAVLVGLVLDLALGWWWADAVAGYVIVFYAVREAVHLLRPAPRGA
jgi:divalent metal cation (Fe/Co/Zn/Cd) transporter